MLRGLATVWLLVAALACHRDATTWSGEGDLLAIDEAGPWLTIAHDDIPNLMPAMTMRFAVRSPDLVRAAHVGTRVRFGLVRDGERLFVTRLETIGAGRGGGRPGIHDHTPHHGGIVAMVGLLHVEAAASRNGLVRVWPSDVWRVPLPVAGVSGTVEVDGPDGRVTLPLAARDDALVAQGPALAGDDVRVRVELAQGAQPVDVHFVLPLSAAGSGAGGVPAAGCTPVAAQPGTRTPRCTIAFAHGLLAVAATADGALALFSEQEGGVTAWRMPGASLDTGLAPPPPITVTVVSGAEPPHAEGATAIAVRPDGTAAVVGVGRRIVRYDLPSGREARVLATLDGNVRDLAWSPDGTRLLASMHGDPAAQVLDAERGVVVRRVTVPQAAAAVAFRADGRAFVGSDAGAIVLADPAGDAPPEPFADVLQPVESLAATPDRLLCAGADRRLRAWDVRTGASVLDVPLADAAVRVAAAPDGARVAVVLRSGAVDVRRVDGTLLETLRAHTAGVRALAWAGAVLLSGDTDGVAAVWDVAAR